MIYARQSTAITVTVGPVLDADGAAVTDGVVADFKISKNGGAPAALNGSATLTHRHTGHYSLALTTSDVATVGTVEIVIDDTVNGCAPKEIQVVEEAVYDELFAASAPGYVANAPVNVAQWLGTNAATPTVAGVPEVDITHLLGTAWLTPGTAGTPDVNVEFIDGISPTVPITGTSDSGSTTTMVDSARTEADDDWWKGSWILFTSGTLLGQCKLITGFVAATDTITFAPATTQAVSTHAYEIIPAARVDVHSFAGTAYTPASQTSVDDLPTNAELATSQAAADDATIAAIAALNNITAASVWAAATRTLTSGANIALAKGTGVTGFNDIAAGAAMTLTAAYDLYHVDIQLTIDDDNSQDEYTATFFKNGVRLTSGITSPVIQVVKRADGTDLIASTALTQIGSTGSYKKDAITSARLTAGEAAVAVVSATIDASSRSFSRLVGRDA